MGSIFKIKTVKSGKVTSPNEIEKRVSLFLILLEVSVAGGPEAGKRDGGRLSEKVEVGFIVSAPKRLSKEHHPSNLISRAPTHAPSQSPLPFHNPTPTARSRFRPSRSWTPHQLPTLCPHHRAQLSAAGRPSLLVQMDVLCRERSWKVPVRLVFCGGGGV